MDLLIIALLVITISLLLIIAYKQSQQNNTSGYQDILEKMIGSAFQDSRKELNQNLMQNRQEQTGNFNQFRQSFENRLTSIESKQTDSLEKMRKQIEDGLGDFRHSMNQNAKENREELHRELNTFKKQFTENVHSFNEIQKEKFSELAKRQDALVQKTEEKLEKMRETVDEKLQSTLEKRLGESFKIVSERLEAVQQGLGEMKNLATGVGDLKKVLSNVKSKGVLGEIQLESILESILNPEQYDKNVKTKKNSNDLVEFALKMPGHGTDGFVYLPIDAKFPHVDYVNIQDARDAGDKAALEMHTRSLIQSVKRFAKDIKEKYIDPPHTTDFGIMFLPVEGLYAEVIRQPDLMQQLQREYKIVITGPTTMAAILNSLQMGFRTLAIQKRSSEVWQILGAVKNEFKKFGEVLEKTQRKINDANTELDKLVGTRTRMMMSKLKKIEELPTESAQNLLNDSDDNALSE